MKIALVCPATMTSFIKPISAWLKTRHPDWDVVDCYSDDDEEVYRAIQDSDVAWLEWADKLAARITLSGRLVGKKVICRMHSYEVFENPISYIDWDCVDTLIVVSPYMKELVVGRFPVLKKKVVVIGNGVDSNKFVPHTTRGKNMAWIGDIGHKKGPLLLLHAFHALTMRDSGYHLHIAGDFQDQRYAIYFQQMVTKLGLQSNITFHGYVQDMAGWLGDKDYILNTSPMEGNPVGVAEGLMCNLIPLIHDFPGADELYPPHYLWRTIPEFVELALSPVGDVDYRHFALHTLNESNQMQLVEDVLNG